VGIYTVMHCGSAGSAGSWRDVISITDCCCLTLCLIGVSALFALIIISCWSNASVINMVLA